MKESPLNIKYIGLLVVSIILTTLASAVFSAAPTNFNQAKKIIKTHVYYDQNKNGALGTFYCGCDWDWYGESGGRIDFASCGYQVRAQENRAARLEWEHALPISWAGSQLQCWQNGGRKNCQSSDPYFRVMEADLHNLYPSIGEVNGDRSNYRYGMVQGNDNVYGQCKSKVDFKNRTFEPRNEVKGMAARITFYMADRYNFSISKQQQRVLIAWDKQFPPSKWELERDRRIAKIMGHHNGFVTGEKSWRLGHHNSAEGLKNTNEQKRLNQNPKATAGLIHANKNSKIYHLPNCPSYNAMSLHNRVTYKTEQEALNDGFRKAYNCK